MIYGISGKPGGGKSYMLVRLAKKFMERGIDVYSNVVMDFSGITLKAKKGKKLGDLYYWSSLFQFRYIYNGVVLLDEAGSYFEAREWAKFDIEDRTKFQQHRKQLLDIYLAVQDFSRVDLSIRQLTPYIYEVKSLPGAGLKDFAPPKKRHPILFHWRKYSSADIDLKKRKKLSGGYFSFDKKLASCYNTYQFVNLRGQTNFHFILMEEKIKQDKFKIEKISFAPPSKINN